MSETDILRREIKVLTFDLYGTVVDMQSGLTQAATPFLEKKGWQGDPQRFVTWWRRTHFEDSMIDALCDRGHTPYRQIGHRAVSIVMDRAGIEYTREDVEWLVSQIETLKPFDDVIAALERLKERYKLVILSNGDRDMLEAAKPHVGFEFDHVISVQEASAFKPDWRTYAATEEILTSAYPHVERSSIMHVANHAFDCIGARAYGFRAAFIDRRKRPFGGSAHQPDLVVSNFTELANALV